MKISFSTKLIIVFLAFNFFLFFIPFILPSNIYSEIMNEKDYSFFNFESLVFIILCDVSLILGYFMHRPIIIDKISDNGSMKRIYSNKFIILPLLPFIFLTIISIFMILKSYPQIIFLLGSAAAQGLRVDISTQANVMSGAPVVLSGMVWWAVFRMRCTEIETRKKLIVTRAVVILSVILIVASFLIKMSRMELIPLFVGILINYKYAEYISLNLKNSNFLRSIIIITAMGLFIFVLLSFIRGYNSWHEILSQIFSYGPASYNRLSAFLSGRLHFYGESTGIYVSSFQGQIPIIKHFIDIYGFLGEPNLSTAWLRDFNDVSQAGLNIHYTFPTVYGAIYSFFGIFSPIYFVVYGAFIKQALHSLNRKKNFGIVFFPFLVFGVLFLFGWNFCLSYTFIILLITVFLLFMYERFYTLLFISSSKLQSSNKLNYNSYN